jgi:hypothetical protein
VTNQVMKSVSHSHLKNRAGRFWPRSTRLEERRLRVGPLDEGSRHPCLHCVPAPPSTPLVPCLLFLRVVEQPQYSNSWCVHDHRRSSASAAATPGGGQMGALGPSSRPLSLARATSLRERMASPDLPDALTDDPPHRPRKHPPLTLVCDFAQ